MTSEIKVDTISENTSANGVTIDGLTIKDGNIIGDVALAGTTPTFTVGDGGAEDAALIFDGNAVDYYIALDDSADNLIIGSGSTVGSNSLITIDSDGDFTLDAAGDIILDADGGDIRFKDAGTEIAVFENSSSDLQIKASVQDKDIIFRGNDGGSGINALTLDMSDAGKATFNNNVVVSDRVVGSSNLILVSTDSNEKIHMDAGGFIKFETDGSEAVRIDSSQNVGIGTSSIDVSTQAGGSGFQVLQIENAEGGQINLDHNDAGTGSTLGQINFQRAGEVLAEIEGVTDGATDNGRINFRTQPDGGDLAVRWTIDHNGILYPGSTSQGIALGVTAATSSNILDDYEEGTWTPVLGSTGAAYGSVSHSQQLGFYTKIGRQVHVYFSIASSSVTVGSPSGNVSITGVPFTCQNATADTAGSLGYVSNLNINISSFGAFHLGVIMPANDARINFARSRNSNGADGWPATTIPSSGFTITGSCTYYV